MQKFWTFKIGVIEAQILIPNGFECTICHSRTLSSLFLPCLSTQTAPGMNGWRVVTVNFNSSGGPDIWSSWRVAVRTKELPLWSAVVLGGELVLDWEASVAGALLRAGKGQSGGCMLSRRTSKMEHLPSAPTFALHRVPLKGSLYVLSQALVKSPLLAIEGLCWRSALGYGPILWSILTITGNSHLKTETCICMQPVRWGWDECSTAQLHPASTLQEDNQHGVLVFLTIFFRSLLCGHLPDIVNVKVSVAL